MSRITPPTHLTTRVPFSSLLLVSLLVACEQGPMRSSSSDATQAQRLEGPALLKDIHTGTLDFPSLGSLPSMAIPLPSGGTLVALEDEFTGQELWKTDGTAAGTTLVKDIVPGLWSSSPNGFTLFNGSIYFGVELDFGRSALMKTDGTVAGTVIVKALPNLEEPDDQSFRSIVTAGGALYFIQDDKLFKSDGTEAGTVSIQNLLSTPVNHFLSELIPLGNSVYFFVDDSEQNVTLWKTDGTAAGTVNLSELLSSSPGELVVMGQSLYFTDGPFNARELWKTDGTVAGTTLVHRQNGPINQVTVVGTRLFFYGNGKLWKSDGTAAGTEELAAVSPQWMEAVDGTLFLGASDETGVELWKSDGTAAGTTRVKDLFPGEESGDPSPLGAWNGRLVFLATPGEGRIGLWVSDGTEGGTVMLAERPGDRFSRYSARPPIPVGTTLIVELWGNNGERTAYRTDGTPAGTVALGSVRAGTKGSQFTALPLGNVGSKVFFQAQEESEKGLWMSDGTPGGTVRLRGFGSSLVGGARVGSTIFFSAADSIHGYELWKSDGTAAGTALVKNITPDDMFAVPSDLTEFQGAVYFILSDGVNGWELWKSDGTEAGTVLIRDMAPEGDDTYPSGLVVFNGSLFISSSGANSPSVLWKTDGTADGTVKVKNVDARQLTPGGNALFFLADDGSGAEGLWKTDGTEAGTVLVRGGLDEVSHAVWANGRLYFIAFDTAHGFEPWVSDGTADGTHVLKDISPGSTPSFGIGFTALGNRVLFTARDDAHGFELWSTDGTEAGTQRVTDLWPGPTSGIRINGSDDEGTVPFELLPLADRGLALFAGQDEAGGLELWVTDGTTAGTTRYADIAAGPESSYPTGFAAVGGQLFFYAGDAASGREPRAVPLPTAVDSTPPAVTCPGDVSATTTDAQGTTVSYPAATASDASGSPTLSYSHASGSRFAPGNTQVTVTAKDGAGNTAQCSFTVTVTLEQTPPDNEEDSGCGCTSSLGAGAGAGWGLLLLSLASLRPGRRSSRKERTGAAE